MAATPARALNCEATLQAARWELETMEAAGAALSVDFSPISDFRASGDYRRRVAANLGLRVFAAAGDAPSLSNVMAL